MGNEHKPIDCEEVLRSLISYLDGELDKAATADIDHHLKHCRTCYSRAEFERHLTELSRKIGPSKAPAELRRRLARLVEGF
ncbi:MAG: anti-sigma factor [Hyphomicrobiaceae bacterium]|nr:MAG: anti-sigma factor [Hyphomicrobiaceae bacterium]